MKPVRIVVLLVLGALGKPAIPAQAQSDAMVASVRDKHRAALPTKDELTIYSLDWVPTFDEAKQKAAREGRPILLAVVTNSYGDLYSGHC
jgi:hypothetical protein